jgi:hypothetical protein
MFKIVFHSFLKYFFGRMQQSKPTTIPIKSNVPHPATTMAISRISPMIIAKKPEIRLHKMPLGLKFWWYNNLDH